MHRQWIRGLFFLAIAGLLMMIHYYFIRNNDAKASFSLVLVILFLLGAVFFLVYDRTHPTQQ